MPKIKIPEPYGKMKEPATARRQNREHSSEPENTPEGFFESFNNKECEVHLTTGEILTGVLRTDTYNKYDVLLESEEASFLIRKDVIGFVKATLYNGGGRKK